ncbi:hypothetical protein [Modestobacter sp. VKM Ac-2978]|uniref:hypothetical protein n=1 Tax=Modestobacter sp. VKM Ac-2978 TaxID=3004132 RepID=UPI0022AA3CA9|nr:hypothetical protein [Modestobacter sp. VKM Ac-2978]MCZ2849125.1 hypothetical protein [Modestobacter sp. VKM Ac-2978]
MDVVIRVVNTVVVWPVCLLVVLLISGSISAYSVGLPWSRLADSLDRQVRKRAAGDMQRLSPRAEARFAQLLASYDDRSELWEPEDLDTALSAFTGKADDPDFRIRLVADRRKYQEKLLVDLSARSARTKSVGRLVLQWRWWVLLGRGRLWWQGLSCIGRQTATHVVAIALTITATATLVVVVATLFFWLFFWSQRSLLDVAGAAADIGLLAGLLLAAASVFGTFWLPVVRAAPINRRRGLWGALGIGLLAFPLNVIGQELRIIETGTSWIAQNLAVPADSVLPSALVLLAIIGYALWRAVLSIRSALLSSGRPLSQRLLGVGAGVFVAMAGVMMLLVAPFVLRIEALQANVGSPAVFRTVTLWGVGLAFLPGLLSIPVAAWEDRRRLNRYRQAGLVVEDLRSPLVITLLWGVGLLVTMGAEDLVSAVADVSPDWAGPALSVLGVVVLLSVVAVLFAGPVLIGRAFYRWHRRGVRLRDEYFVRYQRDVDGEGDPDGVRTGPLN